MKLAGLPVNPFFLPIYFAQGKWVRAVTPRLPDAAGATKGICAGRESALRLLVIGDSTVAGIGAATHEFALTGRIAHHLTRATKRAVHWRAAGQTHATIPVLREHLLPKLKDETADLIVLSVGVNDTTRLHTPERWEANLRGLLNDVRQQFGNIPIAHAGLPPLEKFPALPSPLRHWIGQRIHRFAEITQQVMREDANGYCFTLPSALATSKGFAPDGYHPNEASYDFWASELIAYLLAQAKAKSKFLC